MSENTGAGADGFRHAVSWIVSEIGRSTGAHEGGSFLSASDIASLRRMDVVFPVPAFWKLAARCISEDLRRGEGAERRWAVIVRGMAIMAPWHHSAGAAPGRVLAETHFGGASGFRIARLLKAEGEDLDDRFLSACRYLADKGRPVDWGRFAAFAFYRNDRARNELARDFYSSETSAK